MNEVKNRITIVIPTYHRFTTVKRAVDSALHQKGDVEVIVVDDNGKGSEDQKHTQTVLQDYIDHNQILYLINPVNRGGAYSRNQGLSKASGEFVTFLDDDDEIDSEKCIRQAQLLESKGHEYSCCYCAYRKVMSDGTTYISDEHVEGDCFRYALSKSIYVGSGSNILVRTSIAKAVGGYDVSFKRNQDLEFLAKILDGYRLAYLDQPLFTVHYEIRETKYSYDQIKAINDHFVDVFKPRIDALSASYSKHIYQIIGVEQFRMALTRHCIVQGLKDAVGRYHVRPWVFIRYFGYLLRRVIQKKSYGFKLD